MNEHNAHIATGAVAEPKIKVEQRGAVQVFTLARPAVLNAFDDEMCAILRSTIPAVARNADVYINALVSESPRAFCAGGDVLALTSQAKRDLDGAKAFLRNEYQLDWLLECYSKPVVSFVDGICMGSGAGLSIYNTHRIAGANFKWAMPEARIGFFPDVGVAYALARMPWPVGLYLGLTGRPVGRQDAQWLKLATHCIDAGRYADILKQLSDAQPVDPLLDSLHKPQQEGPVQKDFGLIRDHFSGGNVAEIVAALETARGAAGEWANGVLADLKRCAPLSLAIADRHIRMAKSLDIRQTLIQDYRLAVRFLVGNDFHEGVRAALRDKDGKPQWSPSRFEDVMAPILKEYFAPLENDLELPSRSEMQAARV